MIKHHIDQSETPLVKLNIMIPIMSNICISDHKQHPHLAPISLHYALLDLRTSWVLHQAFRPLQGEWIGILYGQEWIKGESSWNKL